MIGTKAVLAMTLMTAGGATGASVAYMQTHPLAFTGGAARIVTLPPTVVRPLATASIPPEVDQVVVEDHVVVMEPVTIIASIPPRHVARAAPPPADPAPCSEWTGLATGPEGRRVRMLCTSPSSVR